MCESLKSGCDMLSTYVVLQAVLLLRLWFSNTRRIANTPPYRCLWKTLSLIVEQHECNRFDVLVEGHRFKAGYLELFTLASGGSTLRAIRRCKTKCVPHTDCSILLPRAHWTHVVGVPTKCSGGREFVSRLYYHLYRNGCCTRTPCGWKSVFFWAPNTPWTK